MTTLTWLHISDLHCGAPKGYWGADRVLAELSKDLKSLREEHGLKPDLVFFTGDAAFGEISGSPIKDQFREADTFFKEVCDLCQVDPKKNLFMVPGNHDVNRCEITEQDQEWLDKRREDFDIDAIHHLIDKGGKAWRNIMDRLKDYRDFLDGAGYEHLLADPPDRLIYGHRRTINDVEVGIVGLNSAWSCSSADKHGQLWMGGQWQIENLAKKVRDSQVTIGLLHHPLTWLFDAEGPYLPRKFQQLFDFYLHGHQHDSWVEQVNSSVCISAGCCYERPGKNDGFNIVRLNFDTNSGEVWLREYRDSSGGWGPYFIRDWAPDGVWNLQDLPCFKVAEPPDAVEDGASPDLATEVEDPVAPKPSAAVEDHGDESGITERSRQVCELFDVTDEGPFEDDPALRTLSLDPDFPLNLENVLLYLPSADHKPDYVMWSLQQNSEVMDQVTLIASADPAHQEHLRDLVSTSQDLLVAPRSELLNGPREPDPARALARAVASQVTPVRVSPYQSSYPIDKPSSFFGRQHLINHILKGKTNYFVIGGPGVGKSTLLKAIHRQFSNMNGIRCHYVTPVGEHLEDRLVHYANLRRGTKIEEIVNKLAEGSENRCVLLIDEADEFVRADQRRDFPILRALGRLSQEGRCHFILTGFWDLYAAAALSPNSPLQHLGQILKVGALEREACHDLATHPMDLMSITYESPNLVSELVRRTGQRANLVSTACHEILKVLEKFDRRVITAKDVDDALSSGEMERALEGWNPASPYDTESIHLDQILVSAMIKKYSFHSAEAIDTLFDYLGEDVPPDRIQHSLTRLELAYILRREGTRYTYAVPLFTKKVRRSDPEEQIRKEIATWSTQRST